MTGFSFTSRWQTQTTTNAQHHWTHAWAHRQNGSQIWEGKGMEIADFSSISAGGAAGPGQQRNLCSRSHHAASNRPGCSWESEQKDLWNRAGTKNMPCKPLPSTCHTPSQHGRPRGLSPGTASAHVIQQVGCRPRGLSEMKANPVLNLICQSHPQNSTSAFPFTTRLKAPGGIFSSKCCYFTLTRRSFIIYCIPLTKNSTQAMLNSSIFWDRLVWFISSFQTTLIYRPRPQFFQQQTSSFQQHLPSQQHTAQPSFPTHTPGWVY